MGGSTRGYIFFSLTPSRYCSSDAELVQISARGFGNLRHRTFNRYILPSQPISGDVCLKSDLFVKFFYDARRPKFMHGTNQVPWSKAVRALEDFFHWIAGCDLERVFLVTFRDSEIMLLTNIINRLHLHFPLNVGGFLEVRKALKDNFQLKEYSLDRMYTYFVAERNRRCKDNSAIGDAEKTLAVYLEALRAEKRNFNVDGSLRHVRSFGGHYYIFKV